MNTLDDDLRTMLARQAAAMQVQTPIEDRPLVRVTPPDPRGERRWLLPAAAVVLVVMGGLALAIRRNDDSPAGTPASQAPVSTQPFSFGTPTVRLAADNIDLIVGADIFSPTSAAVHSDPGTAEYTTLELTWVQGGGEQRLYIYFANDGTSWWANKISTSDAAGEWVNSPADQRWFASPLGTPWTGDLDLPTLRITNMTVEAFLRPASCDNPTSPIAVVAAYPTIDGIAGVGNGFGGRVDLIDTATCTPVDPSPYTFTAIVDDPSIAAIYEAMPTSTTTAPGAQPDSSEAAPEQFGSFSLSFLKPGQTTVRITVTDSAGTIIGTVTTPITLRAPSNVTETS